MMQKKETHKHENMEQEDEDAAVMSDDSNGID